jgi:hypothetical protein
VLPKSRDLIEREYIEKRIHEEVKEERVQMITKPKYLSK